jgi:hypothetical protein
MLLQLLEQIQGTDARAGRVLALMLLLLHVDVAGDGEGGGGGDGALELVDIDCGLAGGRRGARGELRRGVEEGWLLELLLLVLLEEEVLLLLEHGLVLDFLELGLLELGLLELLELKMGVHLGLGVELSVDVGVDLLLVLLIFHSLRDGFLHLCGPHAFAPGCSLSFLGCQSAYKS